MAAIRYFFGGVSPLKSDIAVLLGVFGGVFVGKMAFLCLFFVFFCDNNAALPSFWPFLVLLVVKQARSILIPLGAVDCTAAV